MTQIVSTADRPSCSVSALAVAGRAGNTSSTTFGLLLGKTLSCAALAATRARDLETWLSSPYCQARSITSGTVAPVVRAALSRRPSIGPDGA